MYDEMIEMLAEVVCEQNAETIAFWDEYDGE